MTDAKTQLVRGWLTKAQHDLASARVLAASDPPLLDTAIYHCQQAAGKAVKGYLVYCDQEVNQAPRGCYHPRGERRKWRAQSSRHVTLFC